MVRNARFASFTPAIPNSSTLAIPRSPIPSTDLSTGSSGLHSSVPPLLARAGAGGPRGESGFRLRHQPGGGGLDPRLQFGHDAAAVATGRDRREDLDRDPARALEKTAAAPEDAGIDRHRHQRQFQLAVKRGDAGLIGSARAGGG